jgi:hypothetical protein
MGGRLCEYAGMGRAWWKRGRGNLTARNRGVARCSFGAGAEAQTMVPSGITVSLGMTTMPSRIT